MRTAVVIPTFNESQNLRALVQALCALEEELLIIVVDDNSPDGTGEIADELVAEYAEVEVIHREGKGGRGSACIAGFEKAMARPDLDYFIEMDADFSHDPEDVPRLIAAMAGCDVCIGSRYIRGSKIVNWGWQRHVFSHIANGFARFLLGIPIKDYTNGYRCYSRQALQSIDFERIEAHGYIVLSEMAYQLHRAGMCFHEIPIIFVNRRRGQSNTSLAEITDAFLSIVRLRLKYGKPEPQKV